jgi:transposase
VRPLALEELPGWANTVVGDLLSELHRLDEGIATYDQHIQVIARESCPRSLAGT